MSRCFGSRFFILLYLFLMTSNTKNNNRTFSVPIAGMHCRSCEILIEEKLLEVPGIKKADVQYRKGVATISYAAEKPNQEHVETAIREAGYAVGTTQKLSFLSRNIADYQDLGIAIVALLILWGAIRSAGLSNISLVPESSLGSTSPGIILLVGLTAGLSTCMALVGGLVLGVSARHAEKHPEATVFQKFRPHLFFNAGRIASYVVLGGVLGVLGSFFALSGVSLGILTLMIGIVMLLLGLKLTGIFPILERVSLTLPKGIGRFFGLDRKSREYSHRNALILGALTFFLPCGFTQSMQLLAIASGSFVSGAFILGIFALGTAPGLLGIGGLASAVKGVFAKRFFAFSGVLVILFAFFNISNGLTLAGWRNVDLPVSDQSPSQLQETPRMSVDPSASRGGVQIVRMTQDGYGYHPQTISVERGRPVRIIMTSTNPYSCASSFVIPKMNVRKNLQSGENVIEFTPTEAGTIPFSCSMGMYGGAIVVK